ncbi:MAG: dicarboxylate/amino acid:cation symporter [Chromatiales bacterium]|jgi:Na+/H+-dicarboxylate symporter|nr:dicarboxylate/amino acid:cation symporter [Chromatiales bacterium]MDX9766329.1 dicarboxylate/amino acid:cation symporter [Ectothiorhodospiraceae bacterium]
MALNVKNLHPRSPKHLTAALQHLIAGRLWLQVLIGMALGLAVGVLLGPAVGWMEPARASVIGSWLALPGRIFLSMIQMIVMPLVVASIIRGIAAAESVEQLRRLGGRVGFWFVATTLFAMGIGAAAYWLIQPAAVDLPASLAAVPIAVPAVPTLENLPQRIAAVLPTNPVFSLAQGQMLHTVVLSLIGGMALVMLPPSQAKPLLELMGSVQAVCMTVVRWAMYLAPFAVFGLVAQMAMATGLDVLVTLGMYSLTVLLALIVLFGFYLALIALVKGIGPRTFLRIARENLLLAFSTSSSAAVMPLTVQTAEKLGVRPSIAQFVIPIGTTINMNGTALYQMVAVLFLAHTFGVDLGWQSLLLVTFLVVGASIGSPATPGVGIAILAMVLESVGIPAAGIAIILGVDRLLDMCRTTANVTGDLVAALVMERWVGGEEGLVREVVASQKREELRQITGQDVIIK